jgi:hypothetical protein
VHVFSNYVPVQTVKVSAILNVGNRLLEGLACISSLHNVEWVNSYVWLTAG